MSGFGTRQWTAGLLLLLAAGNTSSCKLVATPFRVAGSVVNYSAAAVEQSVERHKQKKARKAREKKALEDAANGESKGKSPDAAPGVLPPLEDNTGVLPPADTLPPLPEP